MNWKNVLTTAVVVLVVLFVVNMFVPATVASYFGQKGKGV